MFLPKTAFPVLFILALCQTSLAAELQYPVSDISPNLVNQADAVIREYHTEVKILSHKEAVKKIKKVVTILNEKGREDGFLYIGYDKFVKVNNIKGNIYDARGKLITKIKASDIDDVSAISYVSIFDDNRMKVFKAKTHSYPYTLEYEYELSTKGLHSYPTWVPLRSTETSLQNASFLIITPGEIKLRFKEINDVSKVKINSVGGKNEYLWEAKGIPAIKLEKEGPGLSAFTPYVMTGPYEFEMGGYKGDLSTWKSMGEWINLLNTGRGVLSEKTINIVRELVKDEPDDLNKAKKIYEYLQNTTRYVSIQLGIGGWQPFEAASVEKNGYGDCKALTNYMMSMLNVAGIKSYYTLVNAGNDSKSIVTDFPSLQFNHAFLCLPLGKDTLWLECTDQQRPFGYMGGFTSDRHVLVINENGGNLVRTPAYTAQQNMQSRKALINLQPNGNASAEISTQYSGQQYNHRFYQLRKTQEEQRQWLYKNISIPSFEIGAYSYSEIKAINPTIIENLQLSLNNYASVSGKRIFLSPNLMNRNSSPIVTQDRKTDFKVSFSYNDIDTVEYFLPEGYYLETRIEDFNIDSEFGNYSSHYLLEENKLIYIRNITIYKGRYPASMYREYANFRKEISKADQAKIVLVNKT